MFGRRGVEGRVRANARSVHGKARIFDPLGMDDTACYIERRGNFPRIAEPRAIQAKLGQPADVFVRACARLAKPVGWRRADVDRST